MKHFKPHIAVIIGTLTIILFPAQSKGSLCSLEAMRVHAIDACEDFLRSVRSTDMHHHTDTMRYDIEGLSEARKMKLRRIPKILKYPEFPKKGYLKIEYPFTKYFHPRAKKNSTSDTQTEDRPYNLNHFEIGQEENSADIETNHRTSHNKHHRPGLAHRHELDRTRYNTESNENKLSEAITQQIVFHSVEDDIRQKRHLASSHDQDHEHVRHRRHGINPKIKYCCEHPKDEMCNLHMCFH